MDESVWLSPSLKDWLICVVLLLENCLYIECEVLCLCDWRYWFRGLGLISRNLILVSHKG